MATMWGGFAVRFVFAAELLAGDTRFCSEPATLASGPALWRRSKISPTSFGQSQLRRPRSLAGGLWRRGPHHGHRLRSGGGAPTGGRYVVAYGAIIIYGVASSVP